MTLDIPVAGTVIDPGLFSGKRRAPRTRRALLVICTGPAVRATGRTVDVSRGGMLLAMTDGDLRAPTDPSRLVQFAARVAGCFPQGMKVTFGEGAVQGHARIVRLVSSPGGDTPILLGCRFDPPLAVTDCARLGITDEVDETLEKQAPHAGLKTEAPRPPANGAAADVAARDELLQFIQDSKESWNGGKNGETASRESVDVQPARTSPPSEAPIAKPVHRGEGLDDEDLRQVNRRLAATTTDASARSPSRGSSPSRSTPGVGPQAAAAPSTAGEVAVHCFPAVVPFLGPRYRGRLVELRTRALTVEFTAPEGETIPVGWAAGIGIESRVVCLRDGRVLWETRARVQRFLPPEPGEPGRVRAVMLADLAPSTAVRRRLGVLDVAGV